MAKNTRLPHRYAGNGIAYKAAGLPVCSAISLGAGGRRANAHYYERL
jgi:hypothetical protein